MNKLAFMYARKAYLLDSLYQKDPTHMLKMTVHLAEFSAMMSKYNESMRYALDGIRPVSYTHLQHFPLTILLLS